LGMRSWKSILPLLPKKKSAISKFTYALIKIEQ